MNKNKKIQKRISISLHSKGFTLIELLVVISIIAMLSSIVLATVNNARQKGTVAAAQTFDGHTYSALFDNLMLEWTFDKDSGITAQDQSGNGNNLTLSNTSMLNPASTNPFRSGLPLTITSPQTASMGSTINNPPAGDFSVSLWLNSTDINTYTFLSNYTGAQSNRTWKLDPHDQSALFFDFRTNGTVYSVPQQGYPIVANQWYQIVAVCNNMKLQMFINGRPVSTPQTISSGGSCGPMSPNPVAISGAVSGMSYYVDNVRIYSQALSLSAIQNMYLANLPKFQDMAVNKEGQHKENSEITTK